jgi:hypothetical protein
MLGNTLRSMAKARKNALSREELPTISTSQGRDNKRPKLNLMISTSLGSLLWSYMHNLQNMSMYPCTD